LKPKGENEMRYATYAVFSMTVVLFASSCYAAPILSGGIIESGRKTNWSVYDEFAIDNPQPSSGEFTYVYNVENVGTTLIPLWQFGLLVDLNDLSSTETDGAGLLPSVVSPGPGQWWANGGTPLSLAPSERSVDLVVTSRLEPGSVLANTYGCNPLICDIGVTEIIGPAVPEPSTLLGTLGFMFFCLATRRRSGLIRWQARRHGK
jgi:hypothetical protein